VGVRHSPSTLCTSDRSVKRVCAITRSMTHRTKPQLIRLAPPAHRRPSIALTLLIVTAVVLALDVLVGIFGPHIPVEDPAALS